MGQQIHYWSTLFSFLKTLKKLNSLLPDRESGAIYLPGANTVQYKKYKININSLISYSDGMKITSCAQTKMKLQSINRRALEIQTKSY